ncbi:ABC transporter ATP-binding protein [Alginatibacterium sediminis]|uniref:ABC transporter ATP-binding protein n=1 Tax=Alginatibacterium sediminis TaxID=2164068 RepID=A0A420E8W0_9ALTE|nr:ATP-binding cassette domain-containing protein [Alginatibacterium sediminis]RKF15778.1 ABC transporter ATP-binding protein [Alginatibacterium sediminis]
MPVLTAHNLGYTFADGHRLFANLSFSITCKRIGVVGRNGCGKSLLAEILAQNIQPSTGSIVCANTSAIYQQQIESSLNTQLTIAQFLGLDDVLNALEQVANGNSESGLFELINERWLLKEQLSKQLEALGLPSNANTYCTALSGGQRSRLVLWCLFQRQSRLLILDEPSNHLDIQSKQWLLQQIQAYPGYIVLISHDRLLLRDMQAIWQLNELGITQYGGGYDFYQQQQTQQGIATQRQLTALDKQQAKLKAQTQKNKEVAEQKAAMGNRLRVKGGQSKLVLDGMRDKATANAAHRKKNDLSRKHKLELKIQNLRDQLENDVSQSIYFGHVEHHRGSLIEATNLVQTYGDTNPLSFVVKEHTKLHLRGPNASGKSSLLKYLIAHDSVANSSLRVNSTLCYLDQHFALIDNTLSLLETIQSSCPQVLQTQARILLAGIGFRADSVHRCASELSGGERMKLAMLIVSHQANNPVLLLDEPDNHLDLQSKLLLSKILEQHRGAFILVSHDHEFAQQSGVNQALDLVIAD